MDILTNLLIWKRFCCYWVHPNGSSFLQFWSTMRFNALSHLCLWFWKSFLFQLIQAFESSPKLTHPHDKTAPRIRSWRFFLCSQFLCRYNSFVLTQNLLSFVQFSRCNTNICAGNLWHILKLTTFKKVVSKTYRTNKNSVLSQMLWCRKLPVQIFVLQRNTERT